MFRFNRSALIFSVTALGCSPALEAGPPPAAPTLAPSPVAVAPKAPALENPGGMWMPSQIPLHTDALKRAGLEIDAKELSDPLSGVLASVVSLGGCSASFVSPEGLIVTNHHCVVGALQYNSTPENNLLKLGFYAKARSEERSNGPASRVFVTRGIHDVTDNVQAALNVVADDLDRYKAYQAKQKELVASCERDRPDTRCRLTSFYDGLKYYVIEQHEIRDVRLVYAPPEGVGNFGGEVDNWRWPRHTGDFAFYRAYVNKDGRSADYSTDNVPYASKHYLKLATRPLAEGDLVFVAGYPGRTSMLKTPFEVEETVSWFYPRRLKFFDEYIAAIDAVGATDANAKLKGMPMWRGLNNYRTKNKGELDGLARGKLLERKQAEEQALKRFIDADAERRAAFGTAVEDIQKALEGRRGFREADAALETEVLMPRLVATAVRIVRMAEERQKSDAEREPAFQERNWRDLEGELLALDKRFDRKLDEALLVTALQRLAKTPPAERCKAYEAILGPKPETADIKKAVATLYGGTKLHDGKRRLELFKKASPAALKQNPDSMIKLALALHPMVLAAEDRSRRIEGRLLLVKPKYMQALLASTPRAVPPDANSTLRISFGTVQKPAPTPGNQAPGEAFTVVSEMAQKHTGQEPFVAPSSLLETVKAGRFGSYVHPKYGQVPLDFMSDIQITNGNSGSATINARGELVGLVFDGTYDSVASDWVYLPDTRSIHVDLRYMLFILDAVEHAGALLNELGVTPQF